jgi:lysozyme
MKAMQFLISVAKKQKYGETINMITSEEGKSLLKKFEGCELEAYQCSANVWTIGYGHTADVKEGDAINQDEAEQLLIEDLVEFEGYVNNAVTVPLKQNQFDALVCWTYNLGVGNLNSSTMLKVLNKGEYDKVPSEMARWNKANGEVLAGLERRRKAEGLLFQGGEWYEI